MTFELQYTDTKSNARAGLITTDHGADTNTYLHACGNTGHC